MGWKTSLEFAPHGAADASSHRMLPRTDSNRDVWQVKIVPSFRESKAESVCRGIGVGNGLADKKPGTFGQP